MFVLSQRDDTLAQIEIIVGTYHLLEEPTSIFSHIELLLLLAFIYSIQFE